MNKPKKILRSVGVYCTEEQWNHIEKRAEELDVSLSKFVTKAAIRAAEGRGDESRKTLEKILEIVNEDGGENDED